MVSAKVIKKLVSENGYEFSEGSEVYFKYNNDDVICLIKKIHAKKGYIDAVNVCINKKDVEPQKFYLKDISNISFTFLD